MEADLIVPPPSNPLGVAKQFAESFYGGDGEQMTLLHHRGLFYDWQGDRWREVEARALKAFLYGWLDNAVWHDEKKDTFQPIHPTRMKVVNVLEALEAHVHVDEYVEPRAWLSSRSGPAAAEMVAMSNGLLHVSSKTLYAHSPRFFNTHALPFPYEPEAPAPVRWQQFLHELWGNDEQSIETLAEIMGYVLAGGTSLQKIFMLVGPKRTGKGTILRVLSALLGLENVAGPTLSSLATNFGLQPLVGKPLASIADARLGARSEGLVAVERLLSISGEDSITIDRKYKEPWTGRLPTRFVILTNEIPRFTDASGALASRFVILTLSNSVYGRENPKLTDELLVEAPAIFNWCLAGLDRLLERGHFVQPESSSSAVQHLEDLASPVSAFVRDRCVVGSSNIVKKKDLWAAWRDWCGDEGAHPGTNSVFFRDLRAAYPAVKAGRASEDGKRIHVVQGIAIAESTTVLDTPATPARDDAWAGVAGVTTIVSPPPLPENAPTWEKDYWERQS